MRLVETAQCSDAQESVVPLKGVVVEERGLRYPTNATRVEDLEPLKRPLSESPAAAQPSELSEEQMRQLEADWAAVDTRLPLLQVPRQKAERKRIFKKLDTNKNGYVTDYGALASTRYLSQYIKIYAYIYIYIHI